ncbi:MAG: YccF domain-containing protein [Gammaproteobacteria bacterium]
MALWPFGRQVVKTADAGVGSVLLNVLWFVLCGWWLALAHLVSAVLLAVTIIGIPLAAGDLKLLPVSINPFGREIVPIDQVSTAVAASRRQG